MMSVKLIGFFAFTIIYLVKAGNAIHCYECNSQTDTTCADTNKVDMMKKVDCSVAEKPFYIIGASESKACLKMVKRDRGQTYTVRGCFFENPLTPGMNCIINVSTPLAVYESCDVCNKDYCNGSVSYYASMVLVYAVVFLTFKNFLV